MRPAAGRLQIYYGGTFDPIHNAHLAMAMGAGEALQAAVHLVPAADPPHRAVPGATAVQRAQMVALAIAGHPGLELERIELERAARQRGRPSYTVDTLQQLRQQWGLAQPLAWLIGGDSLAGLAGWHQWQRLFALAHVIVVGRPGNPLPAALPAALADVVADGRWCLERQQLHSRPAGCLYPLQLPLREESATAVRSAVAAGQAVDDLVPAAVVSYIDTHKLYRSHVG